MLRGFARANKNHRDIHAIALPQRVILIDVHLAQRGAEFAEHRRDQRSRFLTQITTRTSVQRHHPRPTTRQSLVFGSFLQGRELKSFCPWRSSVSSPNSVSSISALATGTLPIVAPQPGIESGTGA